MQEKDEEQKVWKGESKKGRVWRLRKQRLMKREMRRKGRLEEGKMRMRRGHSVIKAFAKEENGGGKERMGRNGERLREAERK